jgi:hypothetical protein
MHHYTLKELFSYGFFGEFTECTYLEYCNGGTRVLAHCRRDARTRRKYKWPAAQAVFCQHIEWALLRNVYFSEYIKELACYKDGTVRVLDQELYKALQALAELFFAQNRRAFYTRFLENKIALENSNAPNLVKHFIRQDRHDSHLTATISGKWIRLEFSIFGTISEVEVWWLKLVPGQKLSSSKLLTGASVNEEELFQRGKVFEYHILYRELFKWRDCEESIRFTEIKRERDFDNIVAPAGIVQLRETDHFGWRVCGVEQIVDRMIVLLEYQGTNYRLELQIVPEKIPIASDLVGLMIFFEKVYVSENSYYYAALLGVDHHAYLDDCANRRPLCVHILNARQEQILSTQI